MIMKVPDDMKFRGRGLRKCRVCGGADGMIRAYGLHVCRRCFREIARDVGFEKLS